MLVAAPFRSRIGAVDLAVCPAIGHNFIGCQSKMVPVTDKAVIRAFLDELSVESME